MKRNVILLLSYLSIFLPAKAQKALFIHTSDGELYTFLCATIDSIAHSKYDVDSILHENWQTQVVYTADSIYRIPLSSISCSSLEDQQYEFQPQVVLMDKKWNAHIIKVEENSITLTSQTPSDIEIQVGSVLLTDNTDQSLPYQFGGKVKEIISNEGGNTYICDNIDITDIYKNLIAFGECLSEQESASSRHGVSQKEHSFVKVMPSLPTEISITGEDAMTFNLGLTASARLRYFYVIENGKKKLTRIKTYYDYDASLAFDIEKEFEYHCDSKDKLPIKLITPIFYGVNAIIIPYGFVDCTARISAGLHYNFGYKGTEEIYRNEFEKITIKGERKATGEPPVVHASLAGELYAGLGVDIGVCVLSERISTLGITLHGGVDLTGELEYNFNPFDGFDTEAYDGLKDSKIQFGGKVEIIPFFTALNYDTREDETYDNINLSFSFPDPLAEAYLFPEFEDLQYSLDKNNLQLEGRAFRSLLMPAEVGLAVVDNTGQLINEIHYWDYSYGTSTKSMSHKFQLPNAGTYTCYPVVRIKFGEKTTGAYLASPSIKIKAESTEEPQLCPDDHHPHLIDLGLPSGTKWACCNIGASSPMDYGGYYAWGETNAKSNFTWKTYQYGRSAEDVDYIGCDIAATNYDAAYVTLGNDYQTPSMELCKELIEKTQSSWVTINGVQGRIFTGETGASIFLPACGCRIREEIRYVGESGHYWTSTYHDTEPRLARNMTIEASGVGYQGGGGRFNGHPIRPVQSRTTVK